MEGSSTLSNCQPPLNTHAALIDAELHTNTGVGNSFRHSKQLWISENSGGLWRAAGMVRSGDTSTYLVARCTLKCDICLPLPSLPIYNTISEHTTWSTILEQRTHSGKRNLAKCVRENVCIQTLQTEEEQCEELLTKGAQSFDKIGQEYARLSLWEDWSERARGEQARECGPASTARPV